MTKCASCQAAPAGIEGHDGLYADTMTGKQMRFTCRNCGCVWTRSYTGQGGFLWSAPDPDVHAGADVPGKRASTK